MSNITFRLTAGTNVGSVRSNNEDNFTVNCNLTQKEWFLPSDSLAEITLGEAGCLFVVADGMGGMNAGEVASDIAVKTIEETFSIDDFSEIISSEDSIKEFMVSAVVKADANIKKRVAEDSSTSGMGTTIVMVWVLEGAAHIVWCGDSRAYRFNKELGLTQLTKDHSYVQQLVDEDKLDPELAFDHPYSNIITRSLGDTKSTVNPDYRLYELSAGDNIILCTDGLCGLCRDEEILAVLEEQDMNNIVGCRNALIDAALEAGGHDNVTVVLFQQVQGNEKKNEYTNTIAYIQKPFYKKTRFWILVTILAILLFAIFAPNKWIGKTISGYRTIAFDKVTLFVGKTYRTIIDNVNNNRIQKAKKKAAEAEVEESFDNIVKAVDTIRTQGGKMVDSKEIDKAMKEYYDQNTELREHAETKKASQQEERTVNSAAKRKGNKSTKVTPKKESKATVKETPKETPKEVVKEVQKETPKETPREVVNEAQKETPKETPKEVVNEAPKEDTKEAK